MAATTRERKVIVVESADQIWRIPSQGDDAALVFGIAGERIEVFRGKELVGNFPVDGHVVVVESEEFVTEDA